MIDAILTARRQLAASAGPGEGQAVRDPVRGESGLAVRQRSGLPRSRSRTPCSCCTIPNFTGKQIVDQVQEEIAKLQNEPVDAKELERVKTQLRANRIQGLQSSLSRARALAQYEIADGNPELINTELDAMLAVTPAQIQAAAKKYFTPDKRAVLEIQPAPQGGPAARRRRDK